MEKQALVRRIREMMRSQHEAAAAAAQMARDAATGDEVRSEGKYDTRGVEASYLAEAQARHAAGLSESLEVMENAAFPDFAPGDPVAAGALVEVDLAGERRFFLLAPKGGGLGLEHEGCQLELLTPGAPLREKLEGMRAGDAMSFPDLLVLDVI